MRHAGPKCDPPGTGRALGECILERSLAQPPPGAPSPAGVAAAAADVCGVCRLFLDSAPRLEAAAAAAAAAGAGGPADGGGGAGTSLCECLLGAALVNQVGMMPRGGHA
jgi:hypothetical protein